MHPKTKRFSFVLPDKNLKTIKDPHHRGFSVWLWDGNSLWIKCETTSKKWTKVNKIKATPPRIRTLLRITNEQFLGQISFKRRSEFPAELYFYGS